MFLINNLQKRSGFTIIELLVFSAIFALVSVSFIAILLSVTRVQVRETANSEVNRQSQFVLQTIQRSIEESSYIEIENPPGVVSVTTTTLVLRSASSVDSLSNIARTYIYATGTFAYIKEGDNGTPERLNTDRVSIDSLSFTKRSNLPGHDSVDISLGVSYRTDNIQKKFYQFIQTAVSRVGAATFDSHLQPGSDDAYTIGSTGLKWKSINDVIHFYYDSPSGINYVGIGAGAITPTRQLEVAGTFRASDTSIFDGKVGIGTANPVATLDITGDIRINSTGLLPPCAGANERGRIFYESIFGGPDYLKVCVEYADNQWGWRYLMVSSTAPF